MNLWYPADRIMAALKSTSENGDDISNLKKYAEASSSVEGTPIVRRTPAS
jgi:hypothetical protein